MYQPQQPKMRVLKRNGQYEEVSFDKILNRIKSLSQGPEFSLKSSIDETLIAQKVVQEIYDGVKTTELDELSSQISIAMYSKNPEFKTLAGRIVISNHHKNTKNTFSEKIELLYNYHKNGNHKPLVAKYLYDLVQENKEKIDSSIDYMKDYDEQFKKQIIDKWNIIYDYIAYTHEEKEHYEHMQRNEDDVSNHIYEHTLEFNMFIDLLK